MCKTSRKVVGEIERCVRLQAKGNRQGADLRKWVSHMCRADILSILTTPPLCLSSGLTPSGDDACNKILVKLAALLQ